MNSKHGHLSHVIRHTLLGAAFAAAAGVPLGAARAQDAASEGLEEIIVTAQKREQSLQDVPVTVSVVTAQEIRDSGATRFDDLIPQIPGVSGYTTGVATSVWAIRGLSSNTSGSGGEPSVGFYQDEAFASYIEFSSFPMFDVSRVEVAKGPQGTLYGKNATAGAILVYSNRPDPKSFAFDGTVSGGNVGQLRGDAAVNIPMGDTMALRLSGMYEEMGAYQKNMLTGGTKGGDWSRWGGRIGFAWDITDSLKAFAYYQASSASSDQWQTNLWDFTGDKNKDHVYSQLPASTDEIDTYAAHLDLDWAVSDQLSFKSITDYRAMPKYQWEADGVGMPSPTLTAVTNFALGVPINTVIAEQGARQNQGKNFATHMFQQELRASWNSGPLFLQGGVNYNKYNENRPQQAAVIHFDASAPSILAGARKVDSTGYTSEHTSLGVFVDGTYDFTDALSLTTGVRYSNEKTSNLNFAGVDLYLAPVGGFGGLSYLDHTSSFTPVSACFLGSLTSPDAPCVAGLKDKRTDDGFTPRIALNYKLNENNSIYGNYARGFKAGGFDIVTDGQNLRTYDPEHVDAFDVGIKGQYPSARYGASVFYNKYKDLQVSAIVNSVNQTSNAASATAKGFEGEATWLPVDSLEVSGNYTYINAEYDDGQVLGIPAKGLKLLRTPENQLNLGLNWRIPVGSVGTISIAPSVHYQSEMQLNLKNRADLRQPAYTTVDARVGFTPTNGHWHVTLYGDNLTGEEILVRAVDLVGFGASYGYRPTEALYRLEVGVSLGGSK